MSANIILSETGYYRSACVECQRRKQKCNREWPCDSCRRRKVPDGCRYNDAALPGESSHHDTPEDAVNANLDTPGNRNSLNGKADPQVFEALAERAFVNLGLDDEPKENAPPEQKQDMVEIDSSIQLEKLLKMLPQRRLMDLVIQLFITDINYHYYIIYPPVFLQDYHIWWDRYTHNKTISLQYTCLLAMLCSCTIQHVAGDLQKAVEAELSDTSENISENIHSATRELTSVIPVGHYHMMNVQRLLHSAYWYKAEARFVEAWHVLNQAILEGKELELEQEAPPDSVSDFDREMRRRLWCVLDTWDWQISSGLSRPKLIDRNGCTVALPELTLEGYNPSPLEHMKMQSDLTRILATRFGAPKNVISTQEIQEYKDIILSWVRRYPPVYDFYNPDTSRDEAHPWIYPHRFYLYTMACLLILNPIRHYMVKSYTWDSPPDEMQCRSDGIYYSLILIKSLRKWVDRIDGRDGRLHFIIFSIFDTAAILCTSVVKDTADTIQDKPDILHAIAESVAMLKALVNISKTAKMSHDILYRLVKKLGKPGQMLKNSGSADDRKKRKIAGKAGAQRQSEPSSTQSSTTPQSTGEPQVGTNLATNASLVGNHSNAAPAPTPAIHPAPPQSHPPASAAAHSMPVAVPQQGQQQQYLQQNSQHPPQNYVQHHPQQQPQPYHQQQAPQQHAPQQYAPQHYAPQQHVPQQHVPQHSHHATEQLQHQQHFQPHEVLRQAPQYAVQPPMPVQHAPPNMHTGMDQPNGMHAGSQHQQQQHIHMTGMPLPTSQAAPGHQPMMQQPGPHVVSAHTGSPANASGHSAERPSPPAQMMPYQYAQPQNLGTGIFTGYSESAASGMPAIATFWDGPPGPMTNTISYSIMGQTIPVSTVPQPQSLAVPQTEEQPVPDLNLANLTEAELGGLAPLWGWHSSNLFQQPETEDKNGPL